MSLLVVAEEFFNVNGIMGIANNGTNISPALWAHWLYGPPRGNAVDPAGDAADQAATAFVNMGRWMIKCPDPTCGSAQVAAETDKRFYCATCENRFASNQTVPTLWPDTDTQDGIEKLLILRPMVNQNWLPGETLDDLALENVANGVGN